tara:strand:- start:104 stop:496 length:393 start_codon:yes stop_codon:yes gene_type:complete
MLTILSDTEVSAIADFVKSITDQLGAIQGVLDTSQTVAFETPTATVAAPPPPKPPKKHRATGATRKVWRKQREALNTVQVLQIKKRLAGGEGATAISRDYKVHLTTINAIKYGRTWKHVTLQQPESCAVA